MRLNHSKSYNQQIRNWLFDVFEYSRKLAATDLNQRVCPICGSETAEFSAHNGVFQYVRCRECTLVFMNPVYDLASVNKGFLGTDKLLMAYFDIVADHVSTASPKPDPMMDPSLKDICQFKKSGKLLDIGCSFGTFLQKAIHFFDVEGLEINPNRAAICARQCKVHTDFLQNLHLPQEYDVVTINQILYGLPNPTELFREINKILTDDGILYVNTPNSDSYASELFGGKSNHIYGYTSLNVFNRGALQRLAEGAGFQIVAFRTEWLDIYVSDITTFLDDPDNFIHKRNSHLDGYEESIRLEDELHREMNVDLGDRGNYLVAVLQKK